MINLWYHSMGCVCPHCLTEDLVFAPEFARIGTIIEIEVDRNDLRKMR